MEKVQRTTIQLKFLCANDTFTKIEYMLDYKTNLSDFESVEIVHSMFPNQD